MAEAITAMEPLKNATTSLITARLNAQEMDKVAARNFRLSDNITSLPFTYQGTDDSSR